MKLSFEVPIPHLNDFQDLQDFHFTLSILYRDPTYIKFLHRIQSEKGELWLDNSYNETSSPDSIEVLKVCEHIAKPQWVIAPDSPQWSTKQIGASFQEAAAYFGRDRTICVVSNYSMARVALEQWRANHLAIAYRARSNWLYEDLLELCTIARVHFLGLLHFDELTDLPAVSCDTSMPVKLALKDETIDTWIAKGCPHIHTRDLGPNGKDFFNTQMTPGQIKLARGNILELKEVVNG